MKKSLIFLLAALSILGCSKQPAEKSVLLKVNNYELSDEEFNEKFNNSMYALNEEKNTKKEFLNNLINQQLILQDAQAHDLDKERNFIKLIEKYWEQSLLKIALDKKVKEISGKISVSDQEIQEVYQAMMKNSKADKSYEQMYSQIKWELTRTKESQAMDEWINSLHKNATIEINSDLLK